MPSNSMISPDTKRTLKSSLKDIDLAKVEIVIPHKRNFTKIRMIEMVDYEYNIHKKSFRIKEMLRCGLRIKGSHNLGYRIFYRGISLDIHSELWEALIVKHPRLLKTNNIKQALSISNDTPNDLQKNYISNLERLKIDGLVYEPLRIEHEAHALLLLSCVESGVPVNRNLYNSLEPSGIHENDVINPSKFSSLTSPKKVKPDKPINDSQTTESKKSPLTSLSQPGGNAFVVPSTTDNGILDYSAYEPTPQKQQVPPSDNGILDYSSLTPLLENLNHLKHLSSLSSLEDLNHLKHLSSLSSLEYLKYLKPIYTTLKDIKNLMESGALTQSVVNNNTHITTESNIPDESKNSFDKSRTPLVPFYQLLFNLYRQYRLTTSSDKKCFEAIRVELYDNSEYSGIVKSYVENNNLKDNIIRASYIGQLLTKDFKRNSSGVVEQKLPSDSSGVVDLSN